MILINDEDKGCLTDLKTSQIEITEFIEILRKEIGEGECSPLGLTETLGAIEFYQSELQYITEMLKVPFDVLVVIEKEE